MLEGDLAAAAKLLAAAPALGWSNGEHPGHLVFPLLASLLGGLEIPQIVLRDLDEIQMPQSSQDNQPRLSTPSVAKLCELAEVKPPTERKERAAIFKAMRDAAGKRIAGVTENQRRRHYAHAASLALTCANADESSEGFQWLQAIRTEYRRYPALRRELG